MHPSAVFNKLMKIHGNSPSCGIYKLPDAGQFRHCAFLSRSTQQTLRQMRNMIGAMDRDTLDYESPKPKPDRFWWYVLGGLLACFMAGWALGWLSHHGFIDFPMH